MLFVDLKRNFVTIGKDEEANLDIGQTWGHKTAGWLNWSDLLDHRRVVLLAEASSGKTEEFRNQAQTLVVQGKAAFFVRIEDLADDGFEAALEPSVVDAFKHWCDDHADEKGWFFLDSVDEARLNHKSLEKALRCFARELHRGVERAHVYISCRVSDWKCCEDRAVVERLLPVWEKAAQPEYLDEDAALLDPIFDKKHGANRAYTSNEEPERKLEALLVVQLIPLNTEQRYVFAAAAEIDRPKDFVEAIELNGLEAYAERPGDLLDLAEYWKSYNRFGNLADMTEHGVVMKLAERDKFRPDNRDLPTDKARHGAERLAAALTLAKSFTLRAPGHEPDPSLATDAIDPITVLDDWTDAERNALMRQGIFSPSTYGRVRFHHRGTQEYLTACWFNRLLQFGCPQTAVWDLIFTTLYDIETLVPSLHAAAAWLAHFNSSICNEIIRREPLVLLRYGDPRSLPLEGKEQLLLTYASRHAVGEISNDSLDHRSLWMFATPDLSDAIRQAWSINDRYDFRIDLLRLVREGVIRSCTDLARESVIDEKANDYLRIVALEAIEACRDIQGLAAAARWVKGAIGRISARLCPYFASILFPFHLTVNDLLEILKHSPKPNNDSPREIDNVIGELWKRCPEANREQLLAGLADLALSQPFKTEYIRISAQHYGLVENLAPIARDALTNQGDAKVSDGLIRLLMAIERADRNLSRDEEKIGIKDLVTQNPYLQRRLFWADVEEIRQNTETGENRLSRVCEIFFYGDIFWQLGPSDLNWLFEDLSERPLEADKQIALNAIVLILTSIGALQDELPRLRLLIAGKVMLEKDLEEYLTPPITGNHYCPVNS